MFRIIAFRLGKTATFFGGIDFKLDNQNIDKLQAEMRLKIHTIVGQLYMSIGPQGIHVNILKLNFVVV